MTKGSQNYQILEELVILSRQKKDHTLVQIGSLISAHQYLLLYKLFQQYVPRGSKVLDWGAGVGHFSYFLCRGGYQAAGFSMEDFTFKSWLKGYSYNFIQGSVNEPVLLPFENNSFDGVASVGVLEHVQEFGGEQLASLKEIRRILRPGGVFICYHLPNRYSAVEYLGKLKTDQFTHLVRFTQKDIEQITKKAGLKLLEVRRYGFLPRNSLGGLPNGLGYSKGLAKFWDISDNILEFIFSPLCQNYFFVARKV